MRGIRAGAAVVAVMIMASLTVLIAPAGAAGRYPVQVSMTFDDGIADQYTNVRPMLQSHGLHATFFVNSNRMGNAGVMTWAQLHDLQSDGDEIGGHTLDHADLTQLSTADATDQVCTDRQRIAAQGFSPTSFAYPLGATNPSVEQIVQGCGYSLARGVGGLYEAPAPAPCSGCPYGAAVPAADPYLVPTPNSIVSTTTLARPSST